MVSEGGAKPLTEVRLFTSALRSWQRFRQSGLACGVSLALDHWH